MIKSYKLFESDVIKVPIVGIPSGEYFEIDSKKINTLKQRGLVIFNHGLDSYVFSDIDYKIIKRYALTYFVEDIAKDQKEKIKSFLSSIDVDRYKINDDYTVDVIEDVEIRMSLDNLPVKFDCVMGDFDVSTCGLLTLQGCPEVVGGNFLCTNNMLDDLRMGPKEVGGNYDVRQSTLKSLEGAPEKIKGDFLCGFNDLKNLKGGPRIVDGSYFVEYCLLTSLEGSPDMLVGDFNCSYNLLEDLKDGPDGINGTYDCSNNDILSLKNGPDMVGIFKCNGNNRLKDLHLAPYCDKVISDNL
jgi:hypothetical protein